jgi:hypothetical protein
MNTDRPKPIEISMDSCVDIPILTCSSCGGDYLHQRKITAHRRPNEDGEGRITELTNTDIIDKWVLPADLEGRRDAVFIEFDCEFCDQISILMIKQHKGSTYIGWVSDEINIKNILD